MSAIYEVDDNGSEWYSDSGMGPNLGFDTDVPESPMYESPPGMIEFVQYKRKKKNDNSDNAQKFFSFWNHMNYLE